MATDKDRSDLIIEGHTCLWDIAAIGDILGLYTGQFRFRCYLDPLARLASSREYRELLGPNPSIVLEIEDNLAFSLSQLKHRIISAPPFWTASGQPGNVPDENIIMLVLDAAISAEIKYKNQLKKKKADALEKAKLAAESILKSQNESAKVEESEEE